MNSQSALALQQTISDVYTECFISEISNGVFQQYSL